MKAVDLFAGCGGLSLGLKRAKIEVTLALDAWEPAVECYSVNFDHPIELFDLSDEDAAIDRVKAENPDLIAGGPPCQEFSHAGKRQEGDRANLTLSYANIVTAVRPQYFIMENVDRAEKSDAFKAAERVFRKARYGLTKVILNASRCGVPQNRKRFFCIGCVNAPDNFLLQDLTDGQRRPMTVKEFFKDDIDIDFYYRHPRNYSRRAVYSVNEPAPTMRGVNRPVPAGYPGHAGDAAPVTSDLRPLTTLERARIQTFPKRFKWIGTKTNVEQMIGNAVPVDLAKYVGKRVYNHYMTADPADYHEFQLVG